MKKFSPLLFGLIVGLVFQARAENPKGATVKIRSYLCHSQSVERIASGALIAQDTHVYVLTTSESVLTQDHGKVCYEVSSGSNETSADLVRKDWAYGFALLQPIQPIPQTTPVQIVPAPTNGGDFVSLTGMETGEKAADSKPGRVLTATSDRHSYPFEQFLTEITDTDIESGFMGGPVWNQKGQLIGIIASEYLNEQAGRPTFPFPWNLKTGERTSQPLVLSQASISDWLSNQAFNGQPDKALTSLDDELSGNESVVTGHLKLTTIVPPAAATDPKAGTFPIGGGDPVGIGGGDTTWLFSKVTGVKTTLGSSDFLIPGFDAWVSQFTQGLTQILGQQPSLEIPFVFFRDTDGTLDYQTYKTLRGFFKSLYVNPGAQAAMISDGNQANFSPLYSQANDCATATVEYFLHPPMSLVNVMALLHRLYMVSTIAESDGWQSLKLAEVQEISDAAGAYAQTWKFIRFFGGEPLYQKAQALYVKAQTELK